MSAPEKIPLAAECRALQRSERAAVDGWSRVARRWGHVALSRVVGGRAATEWMLDRALKSAAASGAGSAFAVPLPYALEGFRERLCLELPTTLLGQRLADWVQCGRQVIHVGDYFLGLGGWDAISYPFSKTGVMREAAELSRLDLDYKSTPSYRNYKKAIDAGRPIRRNKVALSSEALLDAYFERYLGLFRSIRQRGVLPLRDARELTTGPAAESEVRRYRTEAGERDIGIAIGPLGRIYCLPGGKHRAAIATVLGIPSVPVEVRMVHAEWVRGVQVRYGVAPAEAVRRGLRELASHVHGVAVATETTDR
ncbi:hypothetical protein [Aromatoleum sp.]|uniref:hypothetical protein n=1 Tax=Aromatoleum sp. TaxID=2307007 RepID=UPI002FCA43FC